VQRKRQNRKKRQGNREESTPEKHCETQFIASDFRSVLALRRLPNAYFLDFFSFFYVKAEFTLNIPVRSILLLFKNWHGKVYKLCSMQIFFLNDKKSYRYLALLKRNSFCNIL
jgi:hypothetical protein